MERSSVYVTNLPKYPLQFKPVPGAQQRGMTKTHLGGSVVPLPLPCLLSGTAKQEQEGTHASEGAMPGGGRLWGGEEQLTAQHRVWIPRLTAGMLLDKHSLEKLSFVFFLLFFSCFFPLWVKQAQTSGQIHRQGKWK